MPDDRFDWWWALYNWHDILKAAVEGLPDQSVESLRTLELRLSDMPPVPPKPKRKQQPPRKLTKRQAIINAMKEHKAEIEPLGRNAAARYLADLGFEEEHARKVITAERGKKIIPREFPRLVHSRKV
jgi:hypothetical protein